MQGRLLTPADLDNIRELRREHPQWSRRQLSEHLVRQWQWRNEAGRLKDMAVRTLLLKLLARGLIDLPAPLTRNGNRQRRAQPPSLTQSELFSARPDPITGPLSALQPVVLELVVDAPQRRRVTQLLRQHHYQGFSGAVGENVQYLARDAQGRELAVMVFAAAAWKVACCNRTVLAEDWQVRNVTLVVRCRKDIVLCKPARERRRVYGKTKFTPEQVRRWDGLAPWRNASIFHGARYRNVRYKELSSIYWQSGAKQKPLRLIVLASTGYRKSKHGRRQYHKPAYLLTSDLTTPAAVLIQDYFDRWAIEVNHRDEKEILGVGEAQVWNEKSVSKVPALLVAMYSWLILSGPECYGPSRTRDYLPLPKWRKGAKRASCLDMVTLLRRQLAEKPTLFTTGTSPPTSQTMVDAAAA